MCRDGAELGPGERTGTAGAGTGGDFAAQAGVIRAVPLSAEIYPVNIRYGQIIVHSEKSPGKCLSQLVITM
jgi:hypothetical protein